MIFAFIHPSSTEPPAKSVLPLQNYFLKWADWFQQTNSFKSIGSVSKRQTFKCEKSLWEPHTAEPRWVRTGGENPNEEPKL